MIREATRHLREIEIVVFDGPSISPPGSARARSSAAPPCPTSIRVPMALMNLKLRGGGRDRLLMPHEAYSYTLAPDQGAPAGGSVKGLVLLVSKSCSGKAELRLIRSTTQEE